MFFTNNMVSVEQIKEKTIHVLGIMIYRICLDLIYVIYISPLYAYYMGLVVDIHIVNVIVSYILTCLVAFFTGCKKNNMIDVLLNIQLVLTLLPMLSLYALSNRSLVFMVLVCVAHIIQCMIVSAASKVKRVKSIIHMPQSKLLFCIIMGSVLIAGLVYTFSRFGIPSFAAFDFNNIYELRADAGYSFPFSYIVPWCFKVICLFALAVMLYKKNILGIIFCSGFQLYFYLTYANKTTLFSLVLLIGSYFLITKLDIIKGMYAGLITLIISSGFIYKFTGNIVLLSYLIRRTLFVPATIKFAYYDFFSENKLLFCADNSIGHLLNIKSPYQLEAPKLIASYLGVPDSHCNTGYWGDAYANFGAIGVIVFSVLLIILLLLIMHWAEHIPYAVVLPVMIMMFYNLNDGALLTWLLGGGAGLMILLIWLYRNYHYIREEDG